MKAEILSVGTEILLGDIVNTNAHYLSKAFAELGISVYRETTVGDNEDRLLAAMRFALEDCDMIITTGGLGPTTDDITKEIAAKALGKELTIHEPSLLRIKKYFQDNARAMLSGNEKQALFPEDSLVLDNDHGTAPGCIMHNEKGQFIIVLPGPPREMIPMFEGKVRPYLEKLSDSTIVSKSLKVVGMGEWDMATRVRDFITESINPTVAPYAKEGESLLRITAKAESREKCEEMIRPVVAEIKSRLGVHVYGEDGDTLEQVIVDLLIKEKMTLTVAESLTGGMVASRLIAYAGGVSNVINETFVTYSNEAKTKYLGVRKETLDAFGAVSEETCREMVDGLIRETEASAAIATTGVAGPESAEGKPVGLVFIGVHVMGETSVFEYHFSGDRNWVRVRTTTTALDHVRKALLEYLEK